MSEETPPLATPAPDTAWAHIPLWKTFPFRVSAVLAAVMSMVFVLGGYLTFKMTLEHENEDLRQRLFSLASALTQGIDGDRLEKLIQGAGEADPEYSMLRARLKTVAARESDIESIYLLAPGVSPGKLLFVLDASKVTRPAKFGEDYDASEVPVMLQGFSRISVEERPYGDDFGLTQSAYAPILNSSGRSVAVLGVDVLAVNIREIQHQVLVFYFWLFGLSLLLTLLVCFWLGREIRRPLLATVHAVQDIASGRLNTQVDVCRCDEFGVLARGVETMATHLRDRERLRETFGLYISRELADSLLREGRVPELGGTECVATVLFLDIKDFTSVCEGLSPAETITMLNDYLSAMVEVIKEHRGCTLDFMGDAIITVFGAPFYQPDHAHDAVRCALAMERCLSTLNERWQREGLARRWQGRGVSRIQMRVGLHTGSLIAGNIGGATRMKFSVIGDTVNIAARLEALNKDFGTSILLSEEVKVRLPDALSSALVDHGMVEVRGRTHQVRIFSACTKA